MSLKPLQGDLAQEFPTTTWHIGDEFDTDSQRNTLEQEEYWLCDAMEGAISRFQDQKYNIFLFYTKLHNVFCSNVKCKARELQVVFQCSPLHQGF